MIVLQAATARAWIPIEKFAVTVMAGEASSHPQFCCAQHLFLSQVRAGGQRQAGVRQGPGNCHHRHTQGPEPLRRLCQGELQEPQGPWGQAW